MIHPTALIGGPPQVRARRVTREPGFAPRIDESATIEAYVTIDAGVNYATHVGERAWIMKSVHVGHDVYIGDDVEVAPLVSIGGYVVIGDGVRVGQGAVFKPRVRVGAGAVIGAGAVVTKDVPAGETWVGNPARRLERKPTDEELWNEWWEASRA